MSVAAVASRPEVGSSINSREGLDTSSRPMFTLFLCPPLHRTAGLVMTGQQTHCSGQSTNDWTPGQRRQHRFKCWCMHITVWYNRQQKHGCWAPLFLDQYAKTAVLLVRSHGQLCKEDDIIPDAPLLCSAYDRVLD